SGPARKSPGPTRRDRATCSRSRARSWSSGRRGRVQTGVSQPSAARRATNVVTPCRCWWPGWWCRVRQRLRAQAPRRLLTRRALTRASPATPPYGNLPLPSVLLPWLVPERRGIRVRYVRPARHLYEPEELAAALTPRARVGGDDSSG